MIAQQQYRSVDEIRAAFRGAKAKMLQPANAAVIEYRRQLGLSRSTLQKIEAGLRSVPAAMRATMKGTA